MLDEQFRRRVAGVAAVDEGGLDEAAQARILARIVSDGPGLARRARVARAALFAAGPLLAAAAAVAVWVHPHGATDGAVARSAATAAGAAPAALACAARPVPTGADRGFVADADGLRRLDLGSVAVAAGTAGSAVRLTEAASCRTLIALESGTVMVRAKDLGGGELRVHAPGGEVTVHGTLFAVTQNADSFLVEVAEGRVGVVDTAGKHTVSAGERLLVSSLGVVQGALSAERAHELRLALGAPEVVGLDTLQPAAAEPAEPAKGAPAPGGVARGAARPATEAPAPLAAEAVDLPETSEAPAPSAVAAVPSDPLAQAEAARRSGEFQQARQLYRRAGDGAGVTAEAAWVALARMELSLGHTSAALDATKRRQARFGQGTLGPEALWIDVRAYRQTGDMARARALAGDLVARWPGSPQARAAQQWLAGE